MLGRYLIVDVIGQGGMGVVYSAYDTQLDRKLAIKLLRPDLLAGRESDEVESRLLREAQAMARLSHPNVVAVHDVGTYDHRVFLAMEFIEGITLKAWLRQNPSLRARLRVMRDAGRGLAAAHAVGLVHRDFKPDNVIVGRDGRVVVLDFGLACAEGENRTEPRVVRPSVPPALKERSSASDSFSCPLTLTGSVLGTIGFIAPEQAFGEGATASTDQFSYAVTLYLALYGEKPFPEPTLDAYLEQVYAPIPTPKNVKSVPAWLRRVATRGLAPEAKDRFPSIDAMLEALCDDPTELRRRRLLWATAVVAALVTIGILVSAARQKELACAPDRSELRGIWDEAARTALAKLITSSASGGAAMAARVTKRIDEFARDWVAMRSDVCAATRLRRQQSEEIFRLRSDCLDREKTVLQALTSVLTGADDKGIARSIDVVYGLPRTEWCADVSTLRASAGLPDDPEKRRSVLEIRTKIANAKSRTLAGEVREAERLTAETVSLARDVGHDGTTAEALVEVGEVLLQLGDFVRAVPALREGFLLAVGASVDATAVVASLDLAFATGPKLQRGEEARMWLDVARATLKRMGGNNELELMALARESSILNEVEWHPEQAVVIREKLAAEYRTLYGTDLKTSGAIYSLGIARTYLGEYDRARAALEEAVAMDETLGGPSYSGLGKSRYALGNALVSLGQFSAGEELLKSAVEIDRQNGMDYWAAIALQSLTWSATAQGQAERAAATAEQSLAALGKAKRPSVLIPIVDVTAAAAFRNVGRGEDALRLCDEALAEQEKVKGIDPAKSYGWDALRCRAESLMALRRDAEAVPYLERSLTIPRRIFPGDYPLAEFALARALGRLRWDMDRAIALGERAREELRSWPFLKAHGYEIEMWLGAAKNARAGQR